MDNYRWIVIDSWCDGPGSMYWKVGWLDGFRRQAGRQDRQAGRGIGGGGTAASMWCTACSTSAACADEWYGVSCPHTRTQLSDNSGSPPCTLVLNPPPPSCLCGVLRAGRRAGDWGVGWGERRGAAGGPGRGPRRRRASCAPPRSPASAPTLPRAWCVGWAGGPRRAQYVCL
jgi:hypothetical protein